MLTQIQQESAWGCGCTVLAEKSLCPSCPPSSLVSRLGGGAGATGAGGGTPPRGARGAAPRSGALSRARAGRPVACLTLLALALPIIL
jgi:hypothetical protein